MPKIGEEILKKILFPEYPESDPGYVIVVCNPKKEVYLDIPNDTEDHDSFILSRIIKEWNFTDAKGVAEITPENITKALSTVDIAIIMKELGLTGLMSDIKKNS